MRLKSPRHPVFPEPRMLRRQSSIGNFRLRVKRERMNISRELKNQCIALWEGVEERWSASWRVVKERVSGFLWILKEICWKRRR